MTLVERDGRVRSTHMPTVTQHNLHAALRERVSPELTVCSDESASYFGVGEEFAAHEAVNHHKGEYVRGKAHVNWCGELPRALEARRPRHVSSLVAQAPSPLPFGVRFQIQLAEVRRQQAETGSHQGLRRQAADVPGLYEERLAHKSSSN